MRAWASVGPGRRWLLLGSGALGVAAAAGGAAGRLASQPAQDWPAWPAAALCAIRRTALTRYERHLVERRTTRLQARRAATADPDAR